MRKFLLSTIALLMAVATMAGNGSSKANAIDFDWANGNTHEAGTLWYRVDLSPISGMVDPTLALYLTNLAEETANVDVTVSATVTKFGVSKTETQDLNYSLNAGDYKIFSKNVKQLLELGVTDIYLELASDKEIFLSAKKYEQFEIVDEACTKAKDFNLTGEDVLAGETWYRMNLADVPSGKQLDFVVANQGSTDANVAFTISLDCPASAVWGYNWTIAGGSEMKEEFGRIFIDELAGGYVYVKLVTDQPLVLSVEEKPAPPALNVTWDVDEELVEGNAYTFDGEFVFEVPMATLSAPLGMKAEFVVTNNGSADVTLTKQISFVNPVQTTIDKVLPVAAGTSVTKEVVNNMAGVISSDVAYIRFEATGEVTVQLNYVVVDQEVVDAKPIVISTCETSEKLNWNSVVTQKGMETKWYEIDLASIKQNDEHLQLSFTNKTENIVVVMGEILPSCDSETSVPYVCPVLPGQTLSQTFNYNMFALLPHPKHFYVSATVLPTTATSITDFKDVRSKDDIMAFVPSDLETLQAAEVELVANTVSALVDPTACNDATTIVKGVKYEQAAGTTKWYRVTDNLLHSLSLSPDLAFINNGKQAANVTIAATVDCEHATFGMSTISLPTWADLTVYPSRLIGNLLDKALNGDVEEMYLQVTTDQPIAFGLDINYGFGLGCDDAREFDWTKGAVIEKGDAQWLSFDITSAKNNKQQVRLTLTNESNSLAWVAMLTSLTCPFEVALPMVFAIPAGMSIDKVIDYSYFATTRLDQLYVALITEEKISLKAVAEAAQASAGDMAACADAVEVKNGEAYVHNPGTTWYKFDGSLFSDISRLPKFRYAAEATTSMTFGATVGCEYNIATRGTIKMPTTKGLEVSFRLPGVIFEALKRVDNGEADVVYLELTTDKQIKWGMDMEYAGGCEKATALDFNQPINIDLKAGKDIWYQVDLKQLKAMGDKRINFNLNNASSEAVEVEIEVTPTCPLLVSAIKTVAVPANTNLPGFFPASTVINLYDEVIAKFNVPEKIVNNLPSQLQDDMVYFVRVRANGDLHIDNEGGDAPDVVVPGCDKATALDITNEIDVNDIETGWYVVDMTTITGDFTLKFINSTGANQTLDMDFYKGCDSVEATMKDNWLTSYNLVVPTTGIEQKVPYSMISSYITMDELYIYIVKQEGGEVDMACATAELLDPYAGFEIKLEAGKEQWFKIAPQAFKDFTKNLRVKAEADKNITVECAAATSCPGILSPAQSFSLADGLSVDTLLTSGMINMAWDKYGDKVEGVDTAYVHVVANGNLTLKVTPEDVIIPEVPDGCENAAELDFSKTINLSELTTGWYHVDLTPIKNGSVKAVSINNDLGKETGVKFDIFRNCDPSSFLYTYTHAFNVGLFEQSIPSAALSMLGSVDELYIYLTMDVDILTCEDAIEFDWTKGAVHAADESQWYHFDINPVEANAQQVKLTFTNHSNNIAIIYGEVALHCPHKYSIPYALVVPAGMSIDKVVDYSVFASSRVEELYVKVHSTETIELAASSESALVFDNTPCDNATVVMSGVEYKQTAGTSWYKFSKELFMNTGKLPKFYFTTEEEGLTTITVGATVGCEYNIATKTIAVLPGSLNYAMVVPEQMFDVWDKLVSDDVTEVYVELTTNKAVHFSVDMINNTDDACHSAELISIENGIKLEANVDKWYKIDFDVLKAMKSDLAVTVINPSGQPVDVAMELSPTCPVVISANKTITIPGFSEATKIISKSIISKIPGIPFYVRFKASADVEVQFSEYERVEDPTVCQDAINYIWGTDLQLTGNEDAWYKLAIADLRGKNCDITLSVTNSTADTVSAAFELYDSCPVDLPIVSMEKVEAAPNQTTIKTVSSSYLPDDVDTLYLHIRPTDDLIVHLSSTCLPDPVLEYAYDTIADYICANTEYVSPITSEKHMIATAVETWNDTVHVSATLDSVYTFVITPIVAPEVMTDSILASIYGTLPVLTPGQVPTVDVTPIINYYAANDTETIADVVSVAWDNIAVDCDATTHAMTLTVVDTCGNVLTSVHDFPVAARKPGSVTNAYICDGDNYIWKGQAYDSTGVYTMTLQDVNGCDSVVTLNLTVLPATVNAPAEYMTLCDGESVVWNGMTCNTSKAYTYAVKNVLGCDSVVYTLNLTVLPAIPVTYENATICYGETYTWNGQVYAATGMYSDTLLSTNGCDSIITLNLIVKDEILPVVANDTICYGDIYTWNGQVLNATGQYYDTLTTVHGCDSIVTLNLTVLAEIPVQTETASIPYGTTYTWAVNNQTYAATGIYSDTLTTAHGCDSVWILDLTVEAPVLVYAYDTINAFVCDGNVYEDPITKEQHIISSLVPSTLKWNDTVHVSVVLDSVYTINVTPVVAPEVMTEAILATIPGATPVLTAGLMPDVTGTVAAIEAYYAGIDTEAISDVVSVAWDATSVNTAVPCGATAFTMTLVVEDECDNVLTTVLTFPVTPSSTSVSVENVTICHGETYTWLANGVTYNATTTDTVTLSNVNGCDSVVALNLTVRPAVPVTYENAMICYGEDYPWYGSVYTATGQYSVTLQDVNGCDSVVTLNLTVLPEVVTLPAQDTTICYGESFTWHGLTCDASKTYTYKEKNVLGCDSLIYTMNVHVLPAAYEVTKDTLVCAGETFVWNGQTCDATKAYTHTVKNVLGCDSIVYTLNVEFLPAAYDVTKDTLVCAGETFIWYGQTCDATKAYTHTVKNVLGCDSINYTLNVEFLPAVYEVTKDTLVCYGETFIWNGQTCDATKAYTHTVKNVLGCDSIIYTLNVEVLPAVQEFESDTVICYGESILWNGQTCDATMAYTHTVKNVLGCDSIIYTLYVEVLPEATTEYEDMIVCEGDLPIVWRGQVCATVGTYTVVDTYANTGCDSVTHILNLQTYVLTTPAYVNTPVAVCGNPVDVTAATADIKAHIASESNYAPNATVTWYIQKNGTWAALTEQLLKGTDESVTLKYVIASDCGEVSDTFDAIPVEMPTPANDVDMDNIQVVSKYDNRVLLLHLNAILATHGWTPEPAEVKWYRVVNELDTYGQPGDDEFTGITGHYFNYADASVMAGQYYALIVHTTEGNAEECDTYMRTEVITCTVNKVTPRLLSNVARPDDNLTLINLNPEMITEIRVYSTTGELMATYTADQVEEFIFKAAHVSGYYMVDVETEDNKVTLRYVVK